MATPDEYMKYMAWPPDGYDGAADEIKRLRDRNKKLEEALRQALSWPARRAKATRLDFGGRHGEAMEMLEEIAEEKIGARNALATTSTGKENNGDA